jgi:hypothetical protein
MFADSSAGTARRDVTCPCPSTPGGPGRPPIRTESPSGPCHLGCHDTVRPDTIGRKPATAGAPAQVVGGPGWHMSVALAVPLAASREAMFARSANGDSRPRRRSLQLDLALWPSPRPRAAVCHARGTPGPTRNSARTAVLISSDRRARNGTSRSRVPRSSSATASAQPFTASSACS